MCNTYLGLGLILASWLLGMNFSSEHMKWKKSYPHPLPGYEVQTLEFGRPMTSGPLGKVPMGHISAIVSIQNQHTTCEHRNMSSIMRKCQNCNVGTNIIMVKIHITARRP